MCIEEEEEEDGQCKNHLPSRRAGEEERKKKRTIFPDPFLKTPPPVTAVVSVAMNPYLYHMAQKTVDIYTTPKKLRSVATSPKNFLKFKHPLPAPVPQTLPSFISICLSTKTHMVVVVRRKGGEGKDGEAKVARKWDERGGKGKGVFTERRKRTRFS